MKIAKANGYYSNWLAKVELPDNRQINVLVSLAPEPLTGDCLPVIVAEFAQGGRMAVLDAEKWRFQKPLKTDCQP